MTYADGRYGALDIGTVTCRLLVADVEDGRIIDVDKEYAITDLGVGVDATGRLSEAAIERVLACVDRYLEVLARYDTPEHPVRRLIAMATSASRDAANGPEFAARLAERGVTLAVIPGQREAALSFLGFDGMSTLAEETREPEKNIGRGILIALCAIIVVFVAQTYIAAIVQPDWANTDPDMGFFDSVLLVGGPVFYKIMLIINIIAIGIANIMNAQMASSRLLYSMGRDGVIPRAFGKVHPKYQTPWFSAVFLGVVTLCLSIPMGDKMTELAGLVNFGALASFILLNFAVFLFFFIREKKRNTFGDIVKYLICPWIGIAILLYVFTGFETMTYIVGVVWLVIGLIIGAVKSKGYKEVPEAFKHLEV